MTAMCSLLFADLPPFVMCQGQPAAARSMNFEGLRRRGFSPERIAAVKAMHKALYRDDLTLEQAQARIAALAAATPGSRARRGHDAGLPGASLAAARHRALGSMHAPARCLGGVRCSSPDVAMVAGETSGDLLAGLLLDGLQARWPDLQAAGIGGPQMARRGFEAWWPSEKLAVRGYVEVLRHYREIVGIREQLKQRLLAAAARCVHRRRCARFQPRSGGAT